MSDEAGADVFLPEKTFQGFFTQLVRLSGGTSVNLKTPLCHFWVDCAKNGNVVIRSPSEEEWAASDYANFLVADPTGIGASYFDALWDLVAKSPKVAP